MVLLTIRADRLRLRPLGVQDVRNLVDLHADPLVREWLGPIDAPAARARLIRIEGQWHELGYGMFAVEMPGSGFIGRCGFVFWPEMGASGETEIGWVLASGWRGAGLATQAAEAALRWLWQAHPAVEKVTAMIAHGNTASEAVASRVGMRYERDDVFRGAPIQVFALYRGEC